MRILPVVTLTLLVTLVTALAWSDLRDHPAQDTSNSTLEKATASVASPSGTLKYMTRSKHMNINNHAVPGRAWDTALTWFDAASEHCNST